MTRTPLAVFLRDYPWALRARRESLRSPAVPERFAAGDRDPVLLLPGVYETWHYLSAFAERLSSLGHPLVVPDGLGLNLDPIAETARRVHRQILERDLTRLVVLGHSKGGLIGKHLMSIDDTEGRIRRLVAVATPFTGSSRARWTPIAPMRAFRVDDPLIRSLATETRAHSRIVSVYPRIDPHIPEGSALPGARNVEVPVDGHFGLLFDPAGVDAVQREVERPD